ncbi:MAG: hypothetical protein GXP31_05350 [Kiritimatiellaeota bacterium]|nr:hypothetical protein [Kiritimatiellota bacterium]
MSSCPFFQVFMEAQLRRLEAAIAENKWYLSERAGFDVGYEAAEEDFRRHHLARFAREFRVRYCLGTCPGRNYCEMAARFARTPAPFAGPPSGMAAWA